MSDRYWLHRALTRAHHHAAPTRIPLSGDRVYQRDYYSVTLDAKRDPSFLFVGIDGDQVHVRRWAESQYAEAVESVPLATFAGKALEIRYYLRQYEFVARDARRFELASRLRWYEALARWHDLRQRLYNRKSLVLRQRHDLLRKLVEDALAEREEPITAYSILRDLYGPKVGGRADLTKLLRYYKLLLESLHAENLLIQDQPGQSYQLGPKALTALNAYEDEERRHADSVRVQRRMLAIAVFAGIAAAVQAYAAWVGLQDEAAEVTTWVAKLLVF